MDTTLNFNSLLIHGDREPGPAGSKSVPIADGVKLNADILAYSTSKNINGTGTIIGGAIIERGVFDWNNPKYHISHNSIRNIVNFFTARAHKSREHI